jgi:hypothetical protein
MSVAQIAQRILHRARTTEGPEAAHDFALVRRLVHDETRTILATVTDPDTRTRYEKAERITLRWIRNYTDLDFRSLGSYTREELDRIASEPDAF